MSEFRYRAVKPDGTLAEGALAADSRAGALAQIERMQLTPIEISEAAVGHRAAASGVGATPRAPGLFASKRITAGDVEDFTRSLSVMLRGGVSLDRALRVIAEMAQKETLEALISDLYTAVKGGKSFSQALAAHHAVFGDFYINMVRAGEAGGQLAEVLARIGEHLERFRELREGVVSAMIYPAILVVVPVISLFLLLAYVVPQFEALFNDMGDPLPLPTLIILGNVLRLHARLAWSGGES